MAIVACAGGKPPEHRSPLRPPRTWRRLRETTSVAVTTSGNALPCSCLVALTFCLVGFTSSPALGAPGAPSGEQAIRFLEARVRSDPDDVVAHNRLAGLYLQRLRETGDHAWLDHALRSARASLAAVPAGQNADGLAALAHGEYASHNFAGARENAIELARLTPEKSLPYQILGDALVELGEYERAADAYREMERRAPGTVSGETRLAHLAFLRGETTLARRRYGDALALARQSAPSEPETIAWCQWELGELAFSVGEYGAAERHYRGSLATRPDSFRALASLGRVRAARGDLAGGIRHYERAVRILPELTFVAALGDLYRLAGRNDDAAEQYARCEELGHRYAANGHIHDRLLGVYYADHDLEPEEAYEIARREYSARRDIYAADALAWTALKAGRLAEAQAAIVEALRLGTRDAKILYHSGMIARAAGDLSAARDALTRALELNPQFDPLQSTIARRVLVELRAARR